MLNTLFNMEALAGPKMLKHLEDEFQRQMHVNDGEYVCWEDKYFCGFGLAPAVDPIGQAILQHFAHSGCPISMLRFARSLSSFNAEHGPVTSDYAAIYYLLNGLTIISDALESEKAIDAYMAYTKTKEFGQDGVLFDHYLPNLNVNKLNGKLIDMLVTASNVVSPKH